MAFPRAVKDANWIERKRARNRAYYHRMHVEGRPGAVTRKPRARFPHDPRTLVYLPPTGWIAWSLTGTVIK